MNVGGERGGAVHEDARGGGWKQNKKKLEIKMATKRNKSMITCPTEPMVKNLQ